MPSHSLIPPSLLSVLMHNVNVTSVCLNDGKRLSWEVVRFVFNGMNSTYVISATFCTETGP